MALYGYARVSTSDQDLSLQTQILRDAGCEIVRAEKASGSSRTGRIELQLLLEFLRPGDTLMVTRVDRLARSIKDLQDIVYALTQQGVTLRATEQPVDTRSAAGTDRSIDCGHHPNVVNRSLAPTRPKGREGCQLLQV